MSSVNGNMDDGKVKSLRGSKDVEYQQREQSED